jgi:hypothetical protein
MTQLVLRVESTPIVRYRCLTAAPSSSGGAVVAGTKEVASLSVGGLPGPYELNSLECPCPMLTVPPAV